jgi:hypothetical protein
LLRDGSRYRPGGRSSLGSATHQSQQPQSCSLNRPRRDDAHAGERRHALWAAAGAITVVEVSDPIAAWLLAVVDMIPPREELAAIGDGRAVHAAGRNLAHVMLAQLLQKLRQDRSSCFSASPGVHLTVFGEGEAVHPPGRHAPHAQASR